MESVALARNEGGWTKTRAARQVFAAAVGAWVFGGMGSWNDFFVEDENLRQRYEEVSESLFRSALAAFEAVLESSPASSDSRAR